MAITVTRAVTITMTVTMTGAVTVAKTGAVAGTTFAGTVTATEAGAVAGTLGLGTQLKSRGEGQSGEGFTLIVNQADGPVEISLDARGVVKGVWEVHLSPDPVPSP